MGTLGFQEMLGSQECVLTASPFAGTTSDMQGELRNMSRSARSAHKFLETKAKQFLTNLGCQEVYEEHRVVISLNGLSKVFVIDVLGKKDGHCVVVEYGGFQQRKMRALKRTIGEVYTFPYGEDEPILWDGTKEYCGACGHAIAGRKVHNRKSYKETPSLPLLPINESNLLTLKDVASIFQISTGFVWQLIKKGEFKTLNSTRRKDASITPASLTNFMETHRYQGKAKVN